MDDLLRGLSQCTMPKEKWQLTIVGGGSLEAPLKALTKELRLEDNVILQVWFLMKRYVVLCLRVIFCFSFRI